MINSQTAGKGAAHFSGELSRHSTPQAGGMICTRARRSGSLTGNRASAGEPTTSEPQSATRLRLTSFGGWDCCGEVFAGLLSPALSSAWIEPSGFTNRFICEPPHAARTPVRKVFKRMVCATVRLVEKSGGVTINDTEGGGLTQEWGPISRRTPPDMQWFAPLFAKVPLHRLALEHGPEKTENGHRAKTTHNQHESGKVIC